MIIYREFENNIKTLNFKDFINYIKKDWILIMGCNQYYDMCNLFNKTYPNYTLENIIKEVIL